MADVFAALNPILIVSKCVGLGPFFIDKKKKKLQVSTPGIVSSCLLLTLFSLNAGFFMYTKVVFKDERIESYISLATDVILLVSGITVTICSIVFTIVQRKKIVRVVENFYSVSFEMNKLNEKIPYKTLLKYVSLQLTVLFVSIALLLLHSIIYLGGVSTLLYFSYLCSSFLPKIYNFLMEYQFVSGALLLKVHFNFLNKCLMKFNETGKNGKDLPKTSDSGVKNAWVDSLENMENLENQMNKKIITETFSVWESQTSKFRPQKTWSTDNFPTSGSYLLEKIKIIRKIHSSLCEIKEDLNSSYSVQLLTSVAQAFIFITANLYMIFITLSTPATVSVLQLSYPIVWAIAHTVEVVLIVLTCTKTSKTANYTAILVHKLLIKECPINIRNQLKLFSIQLLHRKISFTAAGFFNLDMTLLQAIIGAATTYLVILIQFHNTYEVPHDF